MTLAQTLRLLRVQWLLVLSLTVAGALAGAGYAWYQVPVYSSRTQLFVTVGGASADLSAMAQGSSYTQQRVKSYVQVVTAPDVLEPVIRRLGLASTPDQLGGQVSASNPENTVLLNLTVWDTNPSRARDIANGVAQEFTDYVNRLEVPASNAGSPVKVTVTTPAIAAESPDGPDRAADLLLGLVLGGFAGAGLGLLRETLDRRIGERHDPVSIARAPVLGAVLDDPAVRESPLIAHQPFSARAEAFRHLRTNIRFLSVDKEIRSFVVTSSLEGEGKTTTAANLALAIAQSGERVVLVDADLRRPRISDVFGVSSGVGLTSVLLDDINIEEALQRWTPDLPLYVLSSGPIPPNPSELIGSQRMQEVVNALVALGYLVVLDSPPVLPVTDAAILARITQGALLVIRASSTKVEQLRAATDGLRLSGGELLGLLVNRVSKRAGGSAYGAHAYYYYSGSVEYTRSSASSATSLEPLRPNDHLPGPPVPTPDPIFRPSQEDHSLGSGVEARERKLARWGLDGAERILAGPPPG